MEYDNSVLEYYDQPPQIKLLYSSKNGKRVGVLHTPDFFVIRQSSAGWEEWKTVESLKQLSCKMPERYQLENNDCWRCPPGEKFAENLGLYYRLRTDAEINWILQRNLYFLSDYFFFNTATVPINKREQIIKVVSQNPGIFLDDLLDLSNNYDDVFRLIADQSIYIDLSSFTLTEGTERIPVYIDKKSSEALKEKENIKSYNRLVNDSLSVINQGE
jgi:putative transposase